MSVWPIIPLALAACTALASQTDDLAAIRGMLEEQGKRIAELEKQNQELRAQIQQLSQQAAPAPTNAVAQSQPQSWTGMVGRATDRILAPLTKAGIRITPYGYIKFDAIYNTHKTDGDDYSFYVRPPWARGGGNHETTLSVRESRLGIDLDAPEIEDGFRVNGKFEGDFYSGTVANPAIRLRQVYVNVGAGDGWSLRAGVTYDAWWVLCPTILDGGWGGGMGHPYHRRPQLRLAKETTLADGSRLEARIAGVQNAGTDLDGDQIDDGSASAWPMVQGALVWKKENWTGRDATLSLSGSYGRERLTDASPIANGTYDTDLAMLNAALPILKRWAVSGSLYTGENLDTYKAGICQGINTARGLAIRGHGGWLQSTVDLTDRWQWNLGTCFEDDDDSDLEPRDRTFNTRYYANLFYALTKHVKFAVEYGHLHTRFKGEDPMSDEQLHAAAYYFF